jgi:short-subunit dehydrogenase
MNWKEKYGPWALVTGASSGLGAEFTRQLSARGIHVAMVARREDRMEEIAGEVQTAHGTVTRILPADLTAPEACARIAERVQDLEIGLLVNNAGYGMSGAFTDLDLARQGKMAVLNCVVPTLLTGHLLPPMLARGHGGVIFLASTAAYQPTPYLAAYGATKAYNLMLGEAIWRECRKAGVDSLALSPGFTKTEFSDVASIKDAGAFRESTPPGVVAAALRTLGRRPSVMPGLTNKVAAFFNRLLPRRAVTLVTGAALKGRTRGA